MLQEHKRKAEQDLESFLLAGLDSGDPVEVTPEFWKEMRSEPLAQTSADEH